MHPGSPSDTNLLLRDLNGPSYQLFSNRKHRGWVACLTLVALWATLAGWFDRWPQTLPIDQSTEHSAAQLASEMLQKADGGSPPKTPSCPVDPPWELAGFKGRANQQGMTIYALEKGGQPHTHTHTRTQGPKFVRVSISTRKSVTNPHVNDVQLTCLLIWVFPKMADSPRGANCDC